MGATPTREDADATLNTSIHAPAWGATSSLETTLKALDISIHAPAWGATLLSSRNVEYFLAFQSTLPRGERRCRGLIYFAVGAISIHAPAWGATFLAPEGAYGHNISIHAPAWGATMCEKSTSPASTFQSTLPRGERQCKD